MCDGLMLAVHLLVTFARLLGPGGMGAVAAESLLLKHQLLISNRSRRRAPNLTTLDRFVLGLTTLFVRPRRIVKLGALVRPATLLTFHKALVDRKYCRLFSSRHRRRKPGPKGPSAALIAAIVELKRRNLRFGCVRIAQQIAHAFGSEQFHVELTGVQAPVRGGDVCADPHVLKVALQEIARQLGHNRPQISRAYCGV